MGALLDELGLEIGQLITAPNQVERPFYLNEVLELAGVLEKTGYTFLQASSAERVKRLVPQLAEYVEKYAASALEGNPHIFEKLAEIRHNNSERYMKEMRLNRVRPAANKAWRDKDYVELIRLYESIHEDLTAAESKKLEYSRKHV